MKNKTVKVGAFNVGLQRYWMQFPGLEERLAAITSGSWID